MLGSQPRILIAVLLGFVLGVLVSAGAGYYYMTQVLMPQFEAAAAPDWEAIFQGAGVGQEAQTDELPPTEPPDDYTNPFEEVVTQEEVSDEQYVNPFDVLPE